MPWFKIDDGFYDHPKVEDLPLDCVGLWTLAGTYCARHLTDGFVSRARVPKLGASTEHADILVRAGLWEEVDGGYHFRDWEDYQPTRESVLAERERAARRQREWRERKQASNGKTKDAYDGVGNGERNGVTNTAPTRPGPTIKNTTDDSVAGESDILLTEELIPSTPDPFDDFWATYPLKKAKQAARKSWDKAVKAGVDPSAIIEGAAAYAGECKLKQRDAQYIAHPATWLNAGRWDDGYEAAPVEVDPWAAANVDPWAGREV